MSVLGERDYKVYCLYSWKIYLKNVYIASVSYQRGFLICLYVFLFNLNICANGLGFLFCESVSYITVT